MVHSVTGMTDLSPIRILIVDDHETMRTLLMTILYAIGVKEIREARDGAAAFEVLNEFPADIIFLDWVMAPLDGIEFLRILRSSVDSPNRFLPVIMVTGHTESDRIAIARDAGVTDFLSKPISIKKLADRIVRIIFEPRPFVKTKTFFGPDRRQHSDRDYKGPERRKSGGERHAT
jgi:PleD family two-component response regulator